jgi:hypothetical protein
MADEQGLTSVSLVYNGSLLAELASEGRFISSDPPKRKSSALLLNDFNAAPKSRIISPSGDETRGK